MSSAPLGFAPDGVLTAAVRLPPRDYAAPQARAAFYDSFVERLAVSPGVTEVASDHMRCRRPSRNARGLAVEAWCG